MEYKLNMSNLHNNENRKFQSFLTQVINGRCVTPLLYDKDLSDSQTHVLVTEFTAA